MAFNATSEIENIILNIDEELMSKYIQRLQDFKTRYSYRGDKCFDVAEHIASNFRQNGLEATYHDFSYGGYTMRNVIGQKTGTTSPDEIYIICAHYDSTSPYGWSNAPGADDNGSGTAAVMAAAELLSDYEFNSTIRFIAFSGEEQGLKGSNQYVNHVYSAGENIQGVINLDMIAYNPDPGVTTVRMYNGTNGNSSWLKSFVSDTAARYGHITGMEPIDYGSNGQSDHQPFSAYYQSIMLIEQRWSSNPNYHKITDTIEFLNMTYCANITQLSIATLSELAGICSGDMAPPSHGPGHPLNGAYGRASSTISIEVSDPSGINPSSISMRLNGTVVVPMLIDIPLGYNLTYTTTQPYPDGALINVSVSAADMQGNAMNHSWEFTVDAIPPEPPTNFTIQKAAIELKKQGLVLNIGTTGSPDSRHAHSPCVIFKDGLYKMWYSGHDGSKWQICYATSADGLAWNKGGAVLGPGAVGEPDNNYASHPTVLFDDEYKMWYSGYNGVIARIMYANSTDGVNWVKQGIALNVGTTGEMDSKFAYTPSVVKTSEYEMWYSGFDGLQYRILYANSSDGLTWFKHNSDLTSNGAGKMYGDGIVHSPEVVYFNGTYHMYYDRYDGLRYKIIHLNSLDGLKWNEMGLAIDAGATGEYDSGGVSQSSILISNKGIMAWYSAFNNNYRIMFANITPNDTAKDISLSWVNSPSPDVVRYEVFRESRPSAFRQPLRATTPEFYVPPVGQTPWTFETAAESNITVHSPTNSFIPQRFYLPDDNIQGVTLYICLSNGSWHKLAQGADYSIEIGTGHVEVFSEFLESGSTVRAWYNHSAGRALITTGNSLADVRAGAGSNQTYCYVVRAVDRAGNIATCSEIPIKSGIQLATGWNLISAPALDSQIPVGELLHGSSWAQARTWEPARFPNHWTSNRPGSATNTLHDVNGTAGVWVRMSGPGAVSVPGNVRNISINLVAGWNLVSYPYYEIKTVNDALYGLPWDRVEAIDRSSPTLLRNLIGSDILRPGQGLWVHVTSDCVWNAVNVP